MDYALSLLKNALRVDKEIVREYSKLSLANGKRINYFARAIRISKNRIPSLERAIKKLQSK